MGDNVKALKNLYAAVGGKASDVADADTNEEVISAIADYLNDNPPIPSEIDDLKKDVDDLQTAIAGLGASTYPIEFDIVTEVAFNELSKSTQGTLVKSLPYVGDTASNTAWLKNFKKVCDTHAYGIGRYVNVGLFTQYSSTSQDASGKYISRMFDDEPTYLNISETGTLSIYQLGGQARFYTVGNDADQYVDCDWTYNVTYDSSTDTFKDEFSECGFSDLV